MHPFMPPLLLGLARLNPFMNNTQLHPLDRQPTQTPHAGRREREAVVGANALRQTVLAHGGITDGIHMLKVQLRYSLAPNQVTAVGVGNGERITAFLISATEEAFAVHAPELMGRRDFSQGRGTRCHPPLALSGMDQPGAAQNRIDGAGGGPVGVTSRLLSARPPFPCAPGRVLKAELQDLRHHGFRCGVRTALGSVPEVLQSGGPGFLKAFDPFVACFAGDSVAQAEFGDAFLAFEHIGDNFTRSFTIRLSFQGMGAILSPCLCGK
jgi:hypothetical protein